MPTVDSNRLKGNFGATYVSALLSSECLVRPVAADTDVGVDLYCETLEGRDPFLHFWVQVKAGARQCRLLNSRDTASCRFSVGHLRYWSRQPVAVFAALVPVNSPPQNSPTVYIVDLTSQLLGTAPHRGKTLKSDYVLRPDNRDDVRQFLSKAVPATTARLQCRAGVIEHIPTLQPSYEQETPSVPITQFKETIRNQIRKTAALSILFLHRSNELNSDRDFRRLLARVAEQFRGDPHWENYMAMALSHHADADFKTAVELYTQARQSIEGDTVLRRRATWKQWQQRIAEIDKLISRARQGGAVD